MLHPNDSFFFNKNIKTWKIPGKFRKILENSVPAPYLIRMLRLLNRRSSNVSVLCFIKGHQYASASIILNKAIESADVKLTFIGKQDEEIFVGAHLGESLLDVSQRYLLDVPGTCEGSMACTTCHMVFDQTLFSVLPKPSDDEEDALEVVF